MMQYVGNLTPAELAEMIGSLIPGTPTMLASMQADWTGSDWSIRLSWEEVRTQVKVLCNENWKSYQIYREEPRLTNVLQDCVPIN